ncbi:golgin subfamily B member 1-like [Ixodes scapularis]|uniref:golgin subfamily B member 1-like n=1 Tax=Ixodes scapularis TaxID=6945 RepID=UPI001A9CCCAF|nr:golgin subfamily B member 1-like [Ixodes scapularis]
MAPLDWDLVLSVPLRDDEDDETAQLYDDLYDQLIKAEVALEELETTEQFKQENKELLRQIAELQERTRRSERRKSPEDASQDLGHLEAKLKTLRTELEHKEVELEQEKRTSEKYVSMLSKAEKENKSLKNEVENLQSELQDKLYQLERVESAVESSRLESDSKLSAKLKDKNKQISQLLSDVQDAEIENQRLKDKLEELKANLADAVQQMDVTTDEFLKVQKELQAALKKNESLQLENSQIIEEIRVLKDELERKAEELQRLSESSGQETSALNDIITGKNEEIARYREELHHHKERLAELSLNTEQSTVNALEDRDRQIDHLTKHLEQATKDIEDNSVIIESLRQQQDSSGVAGGGQPRRSSKWFDLQQKLREKSLELKSAQDMLGKVEDEARQKDKELADAVMVMRRYELLLQSREESGSVSASSNTSFTMSQLQAEKKMLKAELKAVKRKYSKQLEHSELKVKQLQKKVSERRKRSKATISRSTSPPSEKRPRTVDVGTHTDKFQAHGNAPRQPSPLEVDDISLLSQCTSLAHLYRDLMNERSDWKTRVEKLSAEKIEIIEEVAGRAASNEQRYNELLNQLSSTDPELKEGLLRLDAEAKQIMDREVALRRRCAVLENERALLQSEISRQTSLSFLKDDIILEQLGQVEEMASLRIKSLQNCLEQTVPKETFQSLYQQHALLAQKFRNVVEELTESGYSDINDLVIFVPTLPKGQLKQKLVAAQMSESSALQETEKLKTLLAKVHAELQTLQKRHEDQGSELLKAKLETHVRVQQLSKVLKQLRFEYCGMVPLDRQAKLLGKIAQLKSENMRLRSAKPSEPRVTAPPGRRETESELDKELDGANLPERWSSEAFQEAFSFLKTHATQLESENLLLEQELHKMQLLLQENEMELNSIRKELLCLQENLQPETSKDQNNLMESLKAQAEELLSLKQNAKLLQKVRE